MLIAFFFLILIFSILFTIEPTNLKNNYSQISEKHDQINLTSIFDFIGYFRITVRLMESNPLLDNYSKTYNKALI